MIAQGISEEGGLFVPESFPDLSRELPALAKLDYPALAKAIFAKFLTDFTEEEIERLCRTGRTLPEKFGGPCPVKLRSLARNGAKKSYCWSSGTAPPAPLRTWPCKFCPTFSPRPSKRPAEGKTAVHPDGHFRGYRQGGAGGL